MTGEPITVAVPDEPSAWGVLVTDRESKGWQKLGHGVGAQWFPVDPSAGPRRWPTLVVERGPLRIRWDGPATEREAEEQR